jgi:hypothetical protein
MSSVWRLYKMQDNLLRFKKNQKYIVFDTETESLSLRLARPWQISWLVCQGDKVIKNEDRFLFWDDLKMSDGAAKITRFDRSAWLKKAEDPKVVLEAFDKYLYNPEYIIIGANLFGYDFYIHNTARKEVGLKSDFSYIDRVLDIQGLQKGIYLGLKTVPENWSAWHYKMLHYRKKGMKTSVKYLCGLYDLEYDENRAHDAVYDNVKTFDIFKKQILTIEV